jgi:hypothetical protein
MDLGEPAGDSRLARLSDLCADLGAVTDGQLLGWADPCDPATVPDVVFTVISDTGLLSGGGIPDRNPAAARGRQTMASLPADADALWSRMWEVDEPTAIELLNNLAGSARPGRSHRGGPRRPSQDQPGDFFREIAHLTGPGSRWWTNTDLTTWNPVTQHTFDAVIVAAGNGMTVTLIAFEGGG